MINSRILLVVLFFTSLTVSSQSLTVDQTTLTPQQLVEDVLVSGCFDVSNVTYNDPTGKSIGYFNSNGGVNIDGSPFPISEGVFFGTTENATFAQGPNTGSMDYSFITGDLSIPTYIGASDPDLESIASNTVIEAAILEFEFIPNSNTLQFSYIFASEEYPEYACDVFNDVFGFFLTGPNPTGVDYSSTNIAFVPGTTTPVSINTINANATMQYNVNTNTDCISADPNFASYTQYFIPNTDPWSSGFSFPSNTAIEFDGYTVKLTITVAVEPCETYRLKLAVGDVGDEAKGSGVFLEKGSFSSGSSVNVQHFANNLEGINIVEDCDNYFIFTRDDTLDTSSPLTIDYNISGDVSMGTDIIGFPATIIIPAGQTSITVPYSAIADGITEGNETFIFSYIDGCLCSGGADTIFITIHDAELPLTAISPDTSVCIGESATINIFDNNPNLNLSDLSIIWSDGSTDSLLNVIVNSTQTYSANITFGCGFDTTLYCTITANPCSFSVVVSDTTICEGSIANISLQIIDGEAPFTYQWSGGLAPNVGPHTVNPNTTTNYTVTVTDATGQTAIDTATVEIIESINTDISLTMISCYGLTDGIVDLSIINPSGLYSYNWVNNADMGVSISTNEDLQNLAAGIYNVTIVDSNGCQASASITLTEPSLLEGDISSIDAICSTLGLSTVGITGGTAPYQYLWDDSHFQTTSTATGIVAGNYNCLITDNNGCAITLNTVINNHSSFNNTIQIDHEISCFGENDGQLSVTPLDGTAPYLYEWSNNIGVTNSNPVLSNLVAGVYDVTITDSNGCLSQNSITLSQPTELIIVAFSEAASCYGYSDARAWIETSNGVSPYTYLWSNGNTSDHNINIEANYYDVSVTDANGCLKIKYDIEVEQPNEVILALEYEPTICIGQSAEIRMSGTSSPFSPYTFYWNGIVTSDIITVSPPVTTTYTAQVIDANGCESMIKDLTLIVNPPISLIATSDKDVICKGDIININVEATGGNGNYSYRLLDGTALSLPVLFNPEQSTTYYIIASDDCGSPEDTVIIPVEVKGIVIPSFHANIKTGCEPLSINFIQATGNHAEGTTYLWDFGDASSSNISLENSPNHIYYNAGAFHVTLNITTDFGCKSQAIKYNYITVFPQPEALFTSKPPVTSIIKPVIFFENNSMGADDCIWSFGDNDSTSTWNPEHIYDAIPSDYMVTLVVNTRFGCTDTISSKVSVKDEITIYIPTAFTPDFDGKNEVFIAKGNGISDEGFEMIIFDRWGEEIFTSDKLSKGWNGKVKGGDYGKPGIYAYLIRFVDIYKIPHERSGTVNLIR